LGGTIPTQLAELTELSKLLVGIAKWMGIETTFSKLRAFLFLAGRFFAFGNSLRSTIPYYLGELSNLLQMDLGSNNLTGSIPSELALLTRLGE
jgi:hypothetical protein